MKATEIAFPEDYVSSEEVALQRAHLQPSQAHIKLLVLGTNDVLNNEYINIGSLLSIKSFFSPLSSLHSTHTLLTKHGKTAACQNS